MCLYMLFYLPVENLKHSYLVTSNFSVSSHLGEEVELKDVHLVGSRESHRFKLDKQYSTFHGRVSLCNEYSMENTFSKGLWKHSKGQS